MKTAEEVLKEYVLCECGEIYTSRGLTASDCPLCSMHSCYIEAMEAYVGEYKEGIQHILKDVQLIYSVADGTLPSRDAYMLPDKHTVTLMLGILINKIKQIPQ